MNLLEAIISKIAPHDCLACGSEGDLLCADCSDTLVTIPERCYRCEKPSAAGLTCLACRPTSHLDSVRIAAIYGTVAKGLIWKLKLAGAQSAAAIMAKHMTALIRNAAPKTIIVPVPTATGRVRQRGYDQACLLARELSRQSRLPYSNCLSRSGQTHQHGLHRQQRLVQLEAAFRVRKVRAVQQSRIILVDDVTTTGATLEAAASVLLGSGAARVEAVVFAQPTLSS